MTQTRITVFAEDTVDIVGHEVKEGELFVYLNREWEDLSDPLKDVLLDKANELSKIHDLPAGTSMKFTCDQ